MGYKLINAENRGGKKKFFISLTIDVDPDANKGVRGRVDCVSSGFNGRVSVTAVRKGLVALKDILVSKKMGATFFWEGRTLDIISQSDPEIIKELKANKTFEHGCHGYRHEDYLGSISGIKLSRKKRRYYLEKSTDIISDTFAIRPVGFRAPYCQVGDETLRTLSDLEYLYDSSRIIESGTATSGIPYRAKTKNNDQIDIWEIPVIKWRDKNNQPISGYLWKLLEKKRRPQEYVDMVLEIKNTTSCCFMQTAIHPWHLVINEHGGIIDKEESKKNILSILKKLSQDGNIQFVNLKEYLSHCISRS